MEEHALKCFEEVMNTVCDSADDDSDLGNDEKDESKVIHVVIHC